MRFVFCVYAGPCQVRTQPPQIWYQSKVAFFCVNSDPNGSHEHLKIKQETSKQTYRVEKATQYAT